MKQTRVTEWKRAVFPGWAIIWLLSLFRVKIENIMKLPKAYEPAQYEESIYGLWETSGVFSPSKEGEPYSITLPPPNANGNLHVGHALTVAIQDIQARHQRMLGKSVAFIPGADHAGFETWVVYERHLAKKGKSRFDYSREELYAQVWDFVDSARGNMELQLRQLGGSLDWQHSVFTLDKKVIDTVFESFKKLWDEDLIYRGERIVNYCPTHRTSFADIEIVHKTEKSKLWKIAYPLYDRVGEIIVATTRPETLLGDVAIAVHPDDERYKDLIGTKAVLPLADEEIEIPIIADEAIDPSFGTGAVKITPAHDPVDFEIGERHHLPMKHVIGFDGLTTDTVPSQFAHLPVLEARKRVLAALQAAELIRGESDYEHSVSHCYKCDSVIEPLVKDQWFLRVANLVEKAKKAIAEREVRFVPENKAKQLINYLDGLKDWNLSRQIPWGIPIPAFQNVQDETDWIYDTRVQEAEIIIDGKTYRREEDTFDTWFSSGQWPFITTDYLTDGALKSYYPLSLMETGYDILFPWVSRMLMLGLYRTGRVPFKEVYLHGMVLDEHSQKMSKSKGNVVNPVDIITTYGSDALRMGLIANRSAGLSQAFSISSVVAGRNFANKLWNIARYIEGVRGDSTNTEPTAQSIADHWVIGKLGAAAQKIQSLLTDHRYSESYDVLYHTIWDDVADWYIEASKQSLNLPLLEWVLETSLKLAHPFAPFVTEAIWQTLDTTDDLLLQQKWPTAIDFSDIAAGEFSQLQLFVGEVRFVCQELGATKQTVVYGTDALIHDQAALIERLARLEAVEQREDPSGLRLAVANREAWIAIDEAGLYEHQSKLELRLVETRQQIIKLDARLGNEAYIAQAPEKIVEETRRDLSTHRSLEERLVRELEVLDQAS